MTSNRHTTPRPADRVIVAVKQSFGEERVRVGEAIKAVEDASWAKDMELGVVAGPEAYLYGEETGLYVDHATAEGSDAPAWSARISHG